MSRRGLVSYNPVKINSVNPNGYVSKEGGAYLRQYMHDSRKELKKGNQVLAFYKYQLDALIKEFKDNLEYSYDSKNEWWECRLKETNKYD